MRVLITGATGFLGQHLVAHLLAAGQEVAVLLREAYGSGGPLPPALAAVRQDLHVVYADLRNYRLTSRAIKEARPEAVFHLAAAGVTDPFLSLDLALRHNLNGTINLIRACFEDPIATPPVRLVVARTPGEIGAINVYAASKAAAWQFCRMFATTRAWPIQGAMVFQAYGPGQPAHTLIPAAFAAALAGENFPMTSGTQVRDWIHVDDVVRGLAAISEYDLDPATTVELGSGAGASVIAVVQQIYQLVNRGGKPLPAALAQRPGGELPQIADAEATSQQIGWQTQIGLTQGLTHMMQHYASV